MEDFNIKESRKALTAELEVQKNYLELVPRPSEEDYQRLKENIARNGFDDANPIVVTEDLVVLDGHTRLEIAKELGEEWVYVITKDLEDHYAEKLYIIKRNLLRRHLTTGQRIELGKKLLEIKREEAKERQSRAGCQNLKQNQNTKENVNLQEAISVDDEQSQILDPVVQVFAQPEEMAEYGEQGRSIELTAHDLKTNKETFRQGLKVMEAAETDPEIAEDWGKVVKGEATVNHVYQKVQQKKAGAPKKPKKPKKPPLWTPSPEDVRRDMIDPIYSLWERLLRDVPPPPPASDHALMHVIYGMTADHGISKEEMDKVMAWERSLDKGDSITLHLFRLYSQEQMDIDDVMFFTLMSVNSWRRLQRAKQPCEVPVEVKKLGPWALDSVHQAQLEDLVRDFPPDSAHLIYSDTVLEDPKQVSLLGQLAVQVLIPGKHLCVYVAKAQLPEALARLSAAGLSYHWACSVFRPEDRQQAVEQKVREKWRLLLVFRKGENATDAWDWYDDAVEERQPTNRGMVRQVLKGLTAKGQLVVDPLVGSGMTGQVARMLDRRYLCFGEEAENVRAVNQRLADLRLAEENVT